MKHTIQNNRTFQPVNALNSWAIMGRNSGINKKYQLLFCDDKKNVFCNIGGGGGND